VVSSMTVVIPGSEGPFGMLRVHTTTHRTFSEDDINFLQAVANVLATAIERKEAQQRLEEVREAERSRIGRDLHDEAFQDLSAALVDAQRLKEEDLCALVVGLRARAGCGRPGQNLLAVDASSLLQAGQRLRTGKTRAYYSEKYEALRRWPGLGCLLP
jgi:Histidine kinase